MPTIEQATYERAVIGWEEPIVQGGKLVGTDAVRFRCKAVIAPDRHAAWWTGAIAVAATGLHKSLCPLLF